MGYVMWILVHHVVLVSLVLSIDRGLRIAGQHGIICSSGMFFDIDNGSSCALVALVFPARCPVGYWVT